MSFLSSVRFLRQLARLYSVQTAYYDVSHYRQQASPEALLQMLRAPGKNTELATEGKIRFWAVLPATLGS